MSDSLGNTDKSSEPEISPEDVQLEDAEAIIHRNPLLPAPVGRYDPLQPEMRNVPLFSSGEDMQLEDESSDASYMSTAATRGGDTDEYSENDKSTPDKYTHSNNDTSLPRKFEKQPLEGSKKSKDEPPSDTDISLSSASGDEHLTSTDVSSIPPGGEDEPSRDSVVSSPTGDEDEPSRESDVSSIPVGGEDEPSRESDESSIPTGEEHSHASVSPMLSGEDEPSNESDVSLSTGERRLRASVSTIPTGGEDETSSSSNVLSILSSEDGLSNASYIRRIPTREYKHSSTSVSPIPPGGEDEPSHSSDASSISGGSEQDLASNGNPILLNMLNRRPLSPPEIEQLYSSVMHVELPMTNAKLTEILNEMQISSEKIHQHGTNSSNPSNIADTVKDEELNLVSTSKKSELSAEVPDSVSSKDKSLPKLGSVPKVTVKFSTDCISSSASTQSDDIAKQMVQKESAQKRASKRGNIEVAEKVATEVSPTKKPSKLCIEVGREISGTEESASILPRDSTEETRHEASSKLAVSRTAITVDDSNEQKAGDEGRKEQESPKKKASKRGIVQHSCAEGVTIEEKEPESVKDSVPLEANESSTSKYKAITTQEKSNEENTTNKAVREAVSPTKKLKHVSKGEKETLVPSQIKAEGTNVGHAERFPRSLVTKKDKSTRTPRKFKTHDVPARVTRSKSREISEMAQKKM